MTAFVWNDDRVEQLKTLWASGLTVTEIAVEMAGLTRSAVIGKAHRLQLSARRKAPTLQAPIARPPSTRRAAHAHTVRAARAARLNLMEQRA